MKNLTKDKKNVVHLGYFIEKLMRKLWGYSVNKTIGSEW